MTYPSQPSFTPPYGQPPAPQQRTNLWLVGVAVIAILAIIMTVTLLIVQRTSGGGGGSAVEETTGTDESPSEDEETGEAEPSPSEEETDEGEDSGGGDSASVKIGEEACGNYDLSMFEEVYGQPIDPDETYTSASTSGETGSVSCTFYSEDYWLLSIYVNVGDDPEHQIEWVEDDQEYWEDEEDYDVSDYDYGDAGYMYKYGDPDYRLIQVDVAVSNVEIEVYTWIDTTEFDEDKAEEMLRDAIEQAHEMFNGYVM